MKKLILLLPLFLISCNHNCETEPTMPYGYVTEIKYNLYEVTFENGLNTFNKLTAVKHKVWFYTSRPDTIKMNQKINLR